MKKKWYKTNLGVIFLLVVFFPSGLFYMWKETGWNKKIKWSITAFFLFLILGFNTLASFKADKESLKQSSTPLITSSPSKEEAQAIPEKKTIPPQETSIASPKPTTKSSVVSNKITDKISNNVVKKYPNFEVTIWNKNSEFASEGEIPYEVVINGSFSTSVAANCEGAKMISYYILEALYKDSEIRPTLSRVMVTIPYYLRVSLGANDGANLAESGNLAGPTGFWNVMEQMGLGENENGEMKNRTWGTYLTKCE